MCSTDREFSVCMANHNISLTAFFLLLFFAQALLRCTCSMLLFFNRLFESALNTSFFPFLKEEHFIDKFSAKSIHASSVLRMVEKYFLFRLPPLTFFSFDTFQADERNTTFVLKMKRIDTFYAVDTAQHSINIIKDRINCGFRLLSSHRSLLCNISPFCYPFFAFAIKRQDITTTITTTNQKKRAAQDKMSVALNRLLLC